MLARLALSMGPGGVELGGENVRLEQEPEHGLDLRITILDDDGRPRSIASVFTPGDDPHPELPTSVPFLPGAAIHVIEDRGRDVLLASWRIQDEAAAALDSAFDRVVALSREAGWALEDSASHRTAVLGKEGRRRRVQASQSTGGPVVSVADGPA